MDSAIRGFYLDSAASSEHVLVDFLSTEITTREHKIIAEGLTKLETAAVNRVVANLEQLLHIAKSISSAGAVFSLLRR